LIGLIQIITSSDPGIRNLAVDEFCQRSSTADLLAIVGKPL
jgi:hypothetical protein